MTISYAPLPWLRALDLDGYAIIPDLIDRLRTGELVTSVEAINDRTGVRARKSTTYAVRNLLSLVPAVKELASSPAIRAIVDPVLGPNARPVRGLLFDKSPDANWKVAWHQDLSIAVTKRVEIPGFGPWSEKAGVIHVQPPVSVLEKMVTVRLHLDDCLDDNGPLQVLPGSHRLGFISSEPIPRLRKQIAPVSCTVRAGGVVLMRPLILHASSTASTPSHRRVIHIEYASADALPAGLEWHVSDEIEVI